MIKKSPPLLQSCPLQKAALHKKDRLFYIERPFARFIFKRHFIKGRTFYKTTEFTKRPRT